METPILPQLNLEVQNKDKDQWADRQSCVACSEVSASLNI